MSVLSVLIYILKGSSIRRCVSMRRIEEDEEFLELFAHILVGPQIPVADISTALEQGIKLEWEDVYDLVNPFGDRRGRTLNAVWTFNLDPGNQTAESLQSLPKPYWDLQIDVAPRQRAFLGRILADFGHTWRHILRRHMNSTTFMKLAYTTVWISSMHFDMFERTGFEHVGGQGNGPYAWVTDLPKWDSPKSTFLQVDSTWFVFAQDIQQGIEMAQDHANSHPRFTEPDVSSAIYVILTLRHIVLSKMVDGEPVWTQPEILFGENPSDTAVDMMIWASNTSTAESGPSRIHSLPAEIQDNILYYAATSPVSAGRLGCTLGLGSPFPWNESGLKIEIQERKRNRTENSPVESYIMFNGIMSGLSYKREYGPSTIHRCFSDLPKLKSGPPAYPQTSS